MGHAPALGFEQDSDGATRRKVFILDANHEMAVGVDSAGRESEEVQIAGKVARGEGVELAESHISSSSALILTLPYLLPTYCVEKSIFRRGQFFKSLLEHVIANI